MASLRLPYLFFVANIALQQLSWVSGRGQLYFGFLQYSNDNNRRFDGECCDASEERSGRCRRACQLIFEASIYGLDSPNTINIRPPDKPFNISGQPNLSFNDKDPETVNPLTFTFDKWPGCLDVVVHIYDVDSSKDGGQILHLVDNVTLQVTLGAPTVEHFTLQVATGQRPNQPSTLTVVYRYQCDLTSGSHNPCPPNKESTIACSGSSSSEVSTLTSTLSTFTVGLVTSQVSKTTSQTLTSSQKATTSTPSLGTIAEETSTWTDVSPSNYPEVPLKPTSLQVVPTTPLTSATMSTIILTNAESSRAQMMPIEGAATSSPPHEVNVTNSAHDVMDYWAVILGAVLGSLLIIGVVGFFIYSRRRKTMYKRQEIYTVTPRIVSVVEEDGTAGRGDIPVETAEY